MAQKSKQLNSPKLVTAYANRVRLSPRKLRLVTNLVKHLPVERALTQLTFTNKKGAAIVKKLLQSAIANADHNFSLKPEQLFIKSITCDMGPVMKRYFPRARGSAFVIRRKLAHLNVVLEERPGQAKKAKRTTPAKTVAKPSTQPGAPEHAVTTELQSGPAVKGKKGPKSSEERKENIVQQKRRPGKE
jgi:large subunit ribosomal protein L22